MSTNLISDLNTINTIKQEIKNSIINKRTNSNKFCKLSQCYIKYSKWFK